MAIIFVDKPPVTQDGDAGAGVVLNSLDTESSKLIGEYLTRAQSILYNPNLCADPGNCVSLNTRFACVCLSLTVTRYHVKSRGH